MENNPSPDPTSPYKLTTPVLRVKWRGSDSATIEWDPVEGATGYLIEHNKVGGNNPFDSWIGETSFKMTALRSAMEYYFRVTASSPDLGESPRAEVKFTTKETVRITLPPKPTAAPSIKIPAAPTRQATQPAAGAAPQGATPVQAASQVAPAAATTGAGATAQQAAPAQNPAATPTQAPAQAAAPASAAPTRPKTRATNPRQQSPTNQTTVVEDKGRQLLYRLGGVVAALVVLLIFFSSSPAPIPPQAVPVHVVRPVVIEDAPTTRSTSVAQSGTSVAQWPAGFVPDRTESLLTPEQQVQQRDWVVTKTLQPSEKLAFVLPKEWLAETKVYASSWDFRCAYNLANLANPAWVDVSKISSPQAASTNSPTVASFGFESNIDTPIVITFHLRPQ